jgi:hypothetical protein
MGVALLYYHTMARSVVEIDCGELAAVQAFLGIAHPTGYPLFTTLGNLFLMLPLDGLVIYRLNLLSLIWCVIALGVFYRACRDLTQSEQGNSTDSWIACCGATLLVAANRTVWAQSSSVEVHSLQLFLLACMLLLSLRLSRTHRSRPRLWFLLAAVIALGFSNHMTTILVVPGLIYVFIRRRGFGKNWFRGLAGTAVLFCIVVTSVYAFLPVRALQEPMINWGNPSSFGRFWRHVSGQQYRVWLFSSSEVTVRNLLSFASTLPSQFGYVGFVIGLFGLADSLRRRKTYHLFLFITFLCTVFYAINYDIHDLDAYFLAAYLVFGFWIALGLCRLMILARGRSLSRGAIVGAVLCGIGLSISGGFRRNDRSELFVYEDYTKSVLSSLPKGAILLSYQWDFLVSPAYYYQNVEQYRDDVVVIDKELLRRSWYFDQLRVSHPEVLQRIEPEVQRFVEAVIPFERNQHYNASQIEQRYRALIARLVETGVEYGNVFLGPELVEGEFRRRELSLPAGLLIVPDLLTFRVVRSTDYSPLRSGLPEIRFPTSQDYYSGTIRSLVTGMLVTRAIYEEYHQRDDEARSLAKQIRRRFPDVELPDRLEDL